MTQDRSFVWYAGSVQSVRAARAIPVGRIVALVTILVILRGCATQRVEQPRPEAACRSVGGHQLAAGVAAGVLEGAYRLTLVATGGPKRGDTVAGSLVLFANDRTMRQLEAPGGTYRSDASMPLIGTAEIALEAVGGIGPGPLGSSDPMHPGVAVLERHVIEGVDTARTEITLRFGSEANRRDAMRFDGAFMALHVHAIEDGSFRGTWASGLREPQASGPFCAVRVEGG